MLEVLRDALFWLIGIEILGLAVLPLALRVSFGLPDGGYAIAKMLGLLVLGYIAWITGILGISSFTGATLVVLTAVLAAASWWLWGRELRNAWPSIKPMALGAEATFLAIFVVAALVRSFNAPIAGQEKQMDLTFLHALISSRALPAPDLWLAGYGMPYYYFGYLIQSLLGKALPVDPAAAYNLAVATVLALAAMGAFGIGSGLVRLAGASRRVSMALGALGAFALTIMGNLEAMFEVIAGAGIGDRGFWSMIGIKGLQQANGAGFPPVDGGWGFRAARVIPNIPPDGINEFPYFSFLLGDLHPHYMAIPLAIMIVTLACHELVIARPLRSDPVRLGIAAIVLGAVIPFNTWDVPIFWGIFALALAAAALQQPSPIAALVDRVKDLAATALLALLCYLPYFVGYVSQPLGIGIVDDRTMFGSLFVLFGPLLVLALMGGVVGLLRRVGPAVSEGSRVALPSLVVGVVIALLLTVLKQPTLGFLAATLIYWATLTWLRLRELDSVAGVAAGVLMIAGLGSILIPEVVFLRDVFGSRMNTVFKFYYDAWILLAIAAPVIVWELVVAFREVSVSSLWVRPVAAASLAGAAVLVLGGTIYPVAATATKSSGALGAPTLDGMIHLRQFRSEDAAAIDWLRRNHPGVGVVEAVGDDYTDAGRFSTFAGVPTLVGWPGHEVQWRGPSPAVDQRKELARRVYTSSDVSVWRNDVQQTEMRFVVLGGLEREIYGPTAGVALDQAFPVIQQFGATKVYELVERTK